MKLDYSFTGRRRPHFHVDASYSPVDLSLWSLAKGIRITWELVRQILCPAPDLLNQKFWGRGAQKSVLNTPGDYGAL